MGLAFVAKNSALSALQLVVTSIALFVAYAIISRQVGLGPIGTWAVLLSISNLMTLLDLGAVEGCTRQVAHFVAKQQPANARSSVRAGAFALVAAVTLGVGLFLAAHPAGLLDQATGGIVDRSWAAAAAVTAAANRGSALASAVFEGLERYGARLVTSIIGSLALVLVSIVAVPAFGADGMVMAFSGQAVATLLSSLVLLGSMYRRMPAGGDRIPSGVVIRALIGVGAPIKALTALAFLIDPLARIILTAFGGSSVAGAYEVANRVTTQARAMLVASSQVTLPGLVRLGVETASEAARLEVVGRRVTTFMSLLVFGCLAVASGPLARWLAPHEPVEVALYITILGAGWMVNSISAPYFFANISRRDNRAVWVSGITMATWNALAMPLAGYWMGHVGVVTALAVGLVLGSLQSIRFRLKSDSSRFSPITGVDLAVIASITIAWLLVQVGPEVGIGATLAAAIGVTIICGTAATLISPLIAGLRGKL